MNESWDNLAKETFVGRGCLKCDGYSEEWECDFYIAQLLNGRIVVRVFGLKFSILSRLSNLPNRMGTYIITGKLEQGGELKATGINLTDMTILRSDGGGDYVEGYVIRPGFVEITNPVYSDNLHSTVTYEVTNLSLGLLRHDIEVETEGAEIRLHRIRESGDLLRYAKGLRTSRILSTISIDSSKQISPDTPQERELIDDLCNLLALAQRSCVHRVASHWKASDGVVMRSMYQEPVFEYPPALRPLIPAEALGGFLEDTLKKYNKKLKIWKLPWALDYYVQALALRHISVQSIGFFTALETLKDAFLKQPGREDLAYYVPKGQFKKKKIGRQVLSVLSDNFEIFKCLETDTGEERVAERETLKSKTGELNRRAYKMILREMFKELDIIVEEEDLKRLVDLRNKIIHSGTPNHESERWPNLKEAAIWTYKFSSLVERIFLAILEYHGDFEPYDQTVVPITP